MKKVLEIKHLSKRYGQQLALDNVNLTIQKGEIYGLISSKSLQSLFNQVREVFQSLVLAPRANGHTLLSVSVL